MLRWRMYKLLRVIMIITAMQDCYVLCEKADDTVAAGKYLHDMSFVGTKNSEKAEMHLSVVACGDRLNETVIMLKSAVLLNRAPIHAHIFAEDELQPLFRQNLDAWPEDVHKRFTYSLYPIQFPANENAATWKKLFKTCASQRLFLPDILKDIDSILYVDTDILFLRPFDDIWAFFKKFNQSQVAALSPEHEEPSASWYSRFARHPYVPPYGVNSGVMLMNLTRMRAANWISHIIPYYRKYQYNITWGDQDLINIYFHDFPDQLYIYACNWNYRPDHCMYSSTCKIVEEKGVSVLHGCRGVYHNDKQPVFRAIYETIRDHKFDQSLDSSLVDKMASNIGTSSTSQCKKVAHIFTKQLARQIKKKKRAIRKISSKDEL